MTCVNNHKMSNINIDIDCNYYVISKKFSTNDIISNKKLVEHYDNDSYFSCFFIGLSDLRELIKMKNFIGTKYFLFYDMTDVEFLKLNNICLKIFRDIKFNKIFCLNNQILEKLLEININGKILNPLNQKISNQIKKKILICLNSNSSEQILTHTKLLKNYFDANIHLIDSSGSTNQQINFNEIDIIIFQETFTNLFEKNPMNLTNKKIILIIHSNCNGWSNEKKNIILANKNLFNLIIFTNQTNKNIFEKNLCDNQNEFYKHCIIENQISLDWNFKNNSTIQNDIVCGLNICVGSCDKINNYLEMMKYFFENSKKLSNQSKQSEQSDQSNQLEIYFNLNNNSNEQIEILKNYIRQNQIENIKLFCSYDNFFERFKSAEYYIIPQCDSNEFLILESMEMRKKIICLIPIEQIGLIQFKFYPYKSNSFDTKIYMGNNYVKEDNIFFDRYEQIFNCVNEPNKIYETNWNKKKIGDVVIDTNTTDLIIIDSINNFDSNLLKPGLTFLLRIKNEQECLLNNVYSIYNCADEIVIVDNMSNDNSIEILEYLDKFYKKIFVYYYNVEINKIGLNNSSNNYKKKISTFYNWALSKVTRYNFIKWDGDFIGNSYYLDEMIEKYKLKTRTDNFALWFGGLTKFYNYYINISSYYDEYRCFSKLHGFKWSDGEICESSNSYIYNCNYRYINGYYDNFIPIWLGTNAKKFDFNRKPIFIEHKNYDDYKLNPIDSRCLNDNEILDYYSHCKIFGQIQINKSIGFIEWSNEFEINEQNKIIYKCLKLSNFNINYMTDDITHYKNNYNSYKNLYWINDIIEKIEYFINSFDNILIAISHNILNIEKLLNLHLRYKNKIKIYIFEYSQRFLTNKYLKNKLSQFDKIICANKYVEKLYLNEQLKNIKLLYPNMKLIENIQKKKFDITNVKLLYWSNTSNDKNILTIINSIDKLIDINKNIKLDIYVGSNEFINYYCNNLNNRKNIVIKSNLNDNINLNNIYSNYDINLSLCNNSNNLINILSSINAEIPIICTNTNTNIEIIENYLPMFDITDKTIEIISKINIIINNYDYYVKKIIGLKKNIKKNYFDIKRYAIEISDLFVDDAKFIDKKVL